MASDRSDNVIRSEAAAWLARLRSDERVSADDVGFQTWLNEDLRHRRAFDQVNSAWDIAGGVLAEAQAVREPQRPRRALAGLGIAAALLLAVGAGGAYWLWTAPRTQQFATAVGEQRLVSLADGSVMMLDTSTTVKVLLTKHKRAIELVGGRAHFEVAKCEDRPFEVSFDNRRVVAVGTVFDVTHQGQTASVLLTRGKVLVEAPSGRALMSPGDRIQFRHDAMSADRPPIDALTAWHVGRVVFENETLAQAVAELNRYNQRPLVIADSRVGLLRISGVYKANDGAGFAVSVSNLLPVSVDVRPDRVVLSARPAGAANPQPAS
ncbi:MAG TPA: FecR domain-containing protein [Caulobacteraceae bacterium]|jgi:transmembrane sensor